MYTMLADLAALPVEAWKIGEVRAVADMLAILQQHNATLGMAGGAWVIATPPSTSLRKWEIPAMAGISRLQAWLDGTVTVESNGNTICTATDTGDWVSLECLDDMSNDYVTISFEGASLLLQPSRARDGDTMFLEKYGYLVDERANTDKGISVRWMNTMLTGLVTAWQRPQVLWTDYLTRSSKAVKRHLISGVPFRSRGRQLQISAYGTGDATYEVALSCCGQESVATGLGGVASIGRGSPITVPPGNVTWGVTMRGTTPGDAAEIKAISVYEAPL